MHRTVFRAVIAICAGLIGFTSGGCDGGSDDPGVHTSGRPWVKEQEFHHDPLLHATPEQTVILDLQPVPARAVSTKQRKTFPYLIRDADQGRFSFCIPAAASELEVIELESASGSTVLRSVRGGTCPPIELQSGRYRLHLDYDTTSVAPGGTTAFFYRPEQPRVLDSAEASAPSWDFFTFKAPDGNYVGLANPESNPGAIAAIYEKVAPQTVFVTGSLGIMGSSTCTPETFSIAPFADTPVAGLAWFPSQEAATLIPDSELLSIKIGDGHPLHGDRAVRRQGHADKDHPVPPRDDDHPADRDLQGRAAGRHGDGQCRFLFGRRLAGGAGVRRTGAECGRQHTG